MDDKIINIIINNNNNKNKSEEKNFDKIISKGKNYFKLKIIKKHKRCLSLNNNIKGIILSPFKNKKTKSNNKIKKKKKNIHESVVNNIKINDKIKYNLEKKYSLIKRLENSNKIQKKKLKNFLFDLRKKIFVIKIKECFNNIFNHKNYLFDFNSQFSFHKTKNKFSNLFYKINKIKPLIYTKINKIKNNNNNLKIFQNQFEFLNIKNNNIKIINNEINFNINDSKIMKKIINKNCFV